MNLTDVTLGMMAPSREDADLLRGVLRVLGLRRMVAEVEGYCTSPKDPAARQLVEAQPEVVMLDMQDPPAAIAALEVLHGELPDSWILALSPANDPALIIDAVRAGAREFLVKPLDPGNLSAALGRYLAEKERTREKETSGDLYCVTSAKGGAGATSVTLNLASALSELPDTRVAVLDLNSPDGDAAAYLNLSPRFTVSDALEAADRLDAVLLESYMSHSHGLAILPGTTNSRVDSTSNGRQGMRKAGGIARLINVLRSTYSHTVIDIPSSFDLEILPVVLEAASRMLVVLTPELPALWRTQRLVGFLQSSCPADKLQLVVNRSSGKGEITPGEVEKALGQPVYWQLPNDYRASIEAVNAGRPVVTANHSPLAGSFKDLASHLSGIAPAEKRGGFLRLLRPSEWRRAVAGELPGAADMPAR